MKRGNYAFHVDIGTAYKIISDTFTEREVCDLTQFKLFRQPIMINVVQKGSPYRKMMTWGIRRVTETGLMDRQFKVWTPKTPVCTRQMQANDLKVGMETFLSAFVILCFGFLASAMILIAEIFMKKKFGLGRKE